MYLTFDMAEIFGNGRDFQFNFDIGNMNIWFNPIVVTVEKSQTL